jgi:transposase
MPLRLEERAPARAFWRSHFDVWRLSGLTQRDYCERHGLSLKSFGNWRAQLKREDAVGGDARWGRYPRLRPRSGPMTRPRTKRAEPARNNSEESARRAPTLALASARRRAFSEDAKRRIVEETCQTGATVSAVAKRYRIATSLLFRWRRALGLEPVETARFLPVRIAGDAPGPPEPSEKATVTAGAPTIVIEREAAGVEIQLVGGRRVRFGAEVDPKTMREVVLALETGSELP